MAGMTILDRFLARLDEEGARDGLPQGAVEAARLALARARDAHDPEERTAALAPLARQISDTWPHASTLGRDVLGYVQGLRR